MFSRGLECISTMTLSTQGIELHRVSSMNAGQLIAQHGRQR